MDSPSDGFNVGGGAGGGGVLKETTNRSSHYSNRNSHPLTEREQGLQLEGQKGDRCLMYLDALGACMMLLYIVKVGKSS